MLVDLFKQPLRYIYLLEFRPFKGCFFCGTYLVRTLRQFNYPQLQAHQNVEKEIVISLIGKQSVANLRLCFSTNSQTKLQISNITKDKQQVFSATNL